MHARSEVAFSVAPVAGAPAGCFSMVAAILDPGAPTPRNGPASFAGSSSGARQSARSVSVLLRQAEKRRDRDVGNAGFDSSILPVFIFAHLSGRDTGTACVVSIYR